MGSVAATAIIEWLEQVADGLEAGLKASDAVSLARPLKAGRGQSLEASLRAGHSWVETLEGANLTVSTAERAIIHAAESSGRLPQAFRQIAERRREQKRLARRIKLTLAYPLALLHFAAIVFSLSYLIDGDEISFVVSVAIVVGPVWMVIGWAFLVGRIWPEFATKAARVTPVLSGYRKNWETGVFCEVLASCLEAGMNLDRAWALAAQSADSPRIYRMSEAALAKIQAGGRASEGMAAEASHLPRGLVQAYKSGEETGKLTQNLQAAANRYYTDGKNKLFLASLLYPKILLVVVFGYIAYRVLKMVTAYYQGLLNIGA